MHVIKVEIIRKWQKWHCRRKSSVWEYFTYDSSTGKSFCRVRIVDCSSAAATSSWNLQAQPQSSVATSSQRSTRPICELTWRTAICLSARNSCKRMIDRKLHWLVVKSTPPFFRNSNCYGNQPSLRGNETVNRIDTAVSTGLQSELKQKFKGILILLLLTMNRCFLSPLSWILNLTILFCTAQSYSNKFCYNRTPLSTERCKWRI